MHLLALSHFITALKRALNASTQLAYDELSVLLG